MTGRIASYLAAVLFLAIGTHSQAQTTNAAPSATEQFQQLIQDIRMKANSGNTAEADFTSELATFDRLFAAAKGTNDELAANIQLMKGVLYMEVLKDEDKAAGIFHEIATNFPPSPLTEQAQMNAHSLDAKRIQESLAPATVFPDFSVKSTDGQPLSVSALKGKVVMLDFWATWCPRCVQEMPHVLATYQKLHHDGFEIIGVNMDSNPALLTAFLQKNSGMTWPQYFDGKGWTNALTLKYGVSAIPFTVLIGPDGRIIGKNLAGRELEYSVAALLPKK